MTSSSLLVLPVCFLFFSCLDSHSDSAIEKPPIPVSTKKYRSALYPCPDSLNSCAEVEISVPYITKHAKSTIINQSILKELALVMENFSPDVATLQDIPTVIDSFISQHRSFSREVDFPQRWSFNMKYDVLENNDNSLSLLLNTDIYTGGAHPLNEISILSFNPENGKKVIMSDIIENEKELKNLIGKEFRRKRNLADEINLTDEGFYSNEWPLPKNFALLKQGLYIIYNAYEIGPYVLGSTELLIPFDAIKPLLKE